MKKLCECGCGKKIVIKPWHKYTAPIFINGHYAKKKNKNVRICNIVNCNEKHYGKGLCKKHYDEQYRQENKEYRNKHTREWRGDNKEYVIKYRKEYNQTPAGRASIKAHHHNRRTLLRGLTIAIIQSVYEDNIKKYGRLTCCLCFKPIEFGKDSLEHLTPLSRSGSNDFSNLGVAHLSCNSQKGIKTMNEWFGEKTDINVGVLNESS